MRRRIRNLSDLLIAAGIYAGATLLAQAVPGSLLVALVYALTILMVPGYMLTSCLFPEKTSLGLNDKVAYSIAGGIFLVILNGFILNYGFRVVSFSSILAILSVTILLFGGIAALRRRGRDPDAPVEGINPKLYNRTNRQAVRYSGLVIAVVVLLSLAVFRIPFFSPDRTAASIEFFIAGPDLSDWDYSLQVGERQPVVLGVVNLEDHPVQFQLARRIGGTQVMLGELSLTGSGSGELSDSLEFDAPCSRCQVEYLLYTTDQDTAVSTLILRVTVQAGE